MRVKGVTASLFCSSRSLSGASSTGAEAAAEALAGVLLPGDLLALEGVLCFDGISFASFVGSIKILIKIIITFFEINIYCISIKH